MISDVGRIPNRTQLWRKPGVLSCDGHCSPSTDPPALHTPGLDGQPLPELMNDEVLTLDVAPRFETEWRWLSGHESCSLPSAGRLEAQGQGQDHPGSDALMAFTPITS